MKAMFMPRSLSTLVMWATTPGLSRWTTMTVLYSPVKSTSTPLIRAMRTLPPPRDSPRTVISWPAALTMRMSTVLGWTSVSAVQGVNRKSSPCSRAIWKELRMRCRRWKSP